MKGNMKQTDANKLVEQSFLKVFRRYKGTYSQNDVEEIMKADRQALLKKVEEILEGFINYTDNSDELVDVILKKLKKNRPELLNGE